MARRDWVAWLVVIAACRGPRADTPTIPILDRCPAAIARLAPDRDCRYLGTPMYEFRRGSTSDVVLYWSMYARFCPAVARGTWWPCSSSAAVNCDGCSFDGVGYFPDYRQPPLTAEEEAANNAGSPP